MTEQDPIAFPAGAGAQRAGRPERIECDVLVVGGGVNGAAIARDAAGRGLRVVLCEQDDLASHTSSASSKLIHGGLRYLEHRQFALVRKALAEREVLLKSAPHIMRPLRFVMPHDAGQRPAWLIRAGLFLYDRLARREFLPGSRGVALREHRAGGPLRPAFTRGFVYSDGWVDDARLVALNALDAHERGASVLPRTRCAAVRRDERRWTASLEQPGAARTEVSARCLVNATGPWAGQFLHGVAGPLARPALRLVKGSHIVVPKLFDHSYAYIFQHPDGRIVFTMPYEGAFTLIGTTDVEFRGDPRDAGITAEEVGYLCELTNRYFRRTVTPRDVVWSYAGVRPLIEDAAASAAGASRDYRLERDTGGAPLLSVLGGKITTCRALAEQAVDWIAAELDCRSPRWTAGACLPGGDLFGTGPSARGVIEFESWQAGLCQRHPWLPPALAARFARAYGTRTEVLLAGCAGIGDLGEQVLPGLYEAEVAYLVRHEWARRGADILWRRSKLGLHLPPGSVGVLDAWIGGHAARHHCPSATTSTASRATALHCHSGHWRE